MKKFRWLSMIVIFSGFACVTNLILPVTPRLDTQNIIGFRFENLILLEYTKKIILAALPLETALCYTGFIKDTTYFVKKFMNPLDSLEVIKQLVVITGVTKAHVKDAGLSYVTYHNNIACDYAPNLIATIHSHPSVNRYTHCDHSDMDAIFNHKKQTKYVMSFVWCAYSMGILWADGRRWYIGSFN